MAVRTNGFTTKATSWTSTTQKEKWNTCGNVSQDNENYKIKIPTTVNSGDFKMNELQPIEHPLSFVQRFQALSV